MMRRIRQNRPATLPIWDNQKSPYLSPYKVNLARMNTLYHNLRVSQREIFEKIPGCLIGHPGAGLGCFMGVEQKACFNSYAAGKGWYLHSCCRCQRNTRYAPSKDRVLRQRC